MKRIFALLLIIFLLAAFVPSAFCVAEPNDAAAFDQLLADLKAAAENTVDADAVADFATLEVLGWIERAEALLDSADVQTAHADDWADVQAEVALYRCYFNRADVIKGFCNKVKLNQYVSFAAGDRHTYYYEEWSTISDLFDATIDAVKAATVRSTMEEAVSSFFEEVGQLVTYDELRSQWYAAEEAVVRDCVAQFVAKVDAARTSRGMAVMAAPYFDVTSASRFVSDFDTYAAANMTDASSLTAALRQGFEGIEALDYYAHEADIRECMQGFGLAVESAAIEPKDVRSGVDIAKDHAMDVLLRAIADSEYVASLSGTDAAYYRQVLPEMMRHDLAETDDAEVVQEILLSYLEMLNLEIVEEQQPKSTLDPIYIAMIVTASLSVVLLILYFILRAKAGPKKNERKDATVMLAELQALAAQHKAAEAQQNDISEQAEETSTETVDEAEEGQCAETEPCEQQEQEAEPLDDGEES